MGDGEERSTLLRGGRTLEEKRGQETGSRGCRAEVEVEKKIFLRQKDLRAPERSARALAASFSSSSFPRASIAGQERERKMKK